MWNFTPENPYPLIQAGSYPEEKAHAELVDAWLGLEIEKIEAGLQKGNAQDQRWIGLAPQTLLTPYIELRRILNLLSLNDGECLVDLGAAYGRLGFVMQRHLPKVHFLGLEIVPERVREGSRCLTLHGCENAKLLEADLCEMEIPKAEAYFIYDFGTRGAIEKVLQNLRETSRTKKIQVVGRGRAVRDAIERKHPWLTVVAPQHFPNYSYYCSC